MAANGPAELARIASRLQEMSKTWKLEVARTLRDEVKDRAVPRVQQAARDELPHTGGLNEYIADQAISVSVGLSARGSYVRMKQPFLGGSETDKGYVRHPTYGHREAGEWATTQYAPMAGWWSKTLEACGPETTARLIVIMREFTEAIARAG